MNTPTGSQLIVVFTRGTAKPTVAVTLGNVPLALLKKYASSKPLHRRPRRKKQK